MFWKYLRYGRRNVINLPISTKVVCGGRTAATSTSTTATATEFDFIKLVNLACENNATCGPRTMLLRMYIFQTNFNLFVSTKCNTCIY